MSVRKLHSSTSIKQKKGKSANIVREKQSNSVSTADRHLQHNNSSLHQKNVRVTNKINKLSTCSNTKAYSRPYFTINSFSNHYEMVDRNISTSSKTDVNIYGNVSTTIAAAAGTTTSTNNNNPNNRVDRNSNTLPSGSTNLSRNNGNNRKMTSTIPKQSDPTTSSTSKSNNNQSEGAICDNNNVVTSQVALENSESTNVTVETVKKVKKSRKDKERSSDGSSSKKSSRNPEHHKKRKVKVACTDYSTIERTDAEGAASEDLDFDNDPEATEWTKLRCTSQSTEVVQEREQRRQKRCADYPGLAFGRSVFSSDTLMKFSIIRNELHNIMKSQLKRVNIFSA